MGCLFYSFSKNEECKIIRPTNGDNKHFSGRLCVLVLFIRNRLIPQMSSMLQSISLGCLMLKGFFCIDDYLKTLSYFFKFNAINIFQYWQSKSNRSEKLQLCTSKESNYYNRMVNSAIFCIYQIYMIISFVSHILAYFSIW